jgi:transposase
VEPPPDREGDRCPPRDGGPVRPSTRFKTGQPAHRLGSKTVHVTEPAHRLGGRAGQPAPRPPSAAEPFRARIGKDVARGLTAQRIWQDIREEEGFAGGYDSVKRMVRRLKAEHPEVADVLEHPPGEEAQVDYFKGPPTLDSATGRWRRPWIFRMTLSCSRHGYEEPIWGQDRRSFLRAHEHAFQAFQGVPGVIRFDYVARYIIMVVCPTGLCGQSDDGLALTAVTGQLRVADGT